jgi:PAS domain S-box-containing protein
VKAPQAIFESLFESSLDGVLLVRPDGTVLRANPAACRALARSEEEIRRAGRAELVVDDANLRALLAKREAAASAEGELTYLHADGSAFPVECTTGLIPSGDGPPLAYVIFRDVSARRALEETHRRTDRALRLLTRCNQAVVRATSVVGLFREICKVMVESGGYRMCWVGLPEHDARKSVRPVAHAGHEDGYLKAVEIVWSDTILGRGPTGTAIRTRRPVVGRDFAGDPDLAPWRAESMQRGYRTSVALPLAHEGQELGVLTMYSAVPETFDAEELGILDQLTKDLSYGVHALRRRTENERLTTAIEQAAEAVVVSDLKGNILYVNPAFEKVTGYTRAEALGQNPRMLKSGEQDASFYQALWDTIVGGKTWRGRLVNRTKAGARYTEEASISPVHNASGAIVSYVAVKRDITRDLALEAQLLQSQKMEGIGRLAGGVAHDFNNLLSVVLGSAEFALESLREDDPLREELLEIQKAGQRAAALTRQLLAFSRKQVLQPKPLQLNDVVGDLEKMLRRVLGEDIDLVQELAPDLGQITADPGQIEQVIVNLAVNSRDAMPDGGKLTITTANVDFSEGQAEALAGAAPGPYVMVSVKDSGGGMEQATVARIFEPFFTTKEAGKGTGLGLSTVYGIVKQSGGVVDVASTPGEGTTFSVYLPREITSGPLARSTAPVTRLGGTETVLVVEDDEAVRSLARRILEAAGYTVLTAANGQEALYVCERPGLVLQLVLTDVVMPEMSGRVFIERLGKLRSEIKVVYMSGYTDDAIVHHRVLDPGTHFIGKPLTRLELLRKVREALDH